MGLNTHFKTGKPAFRKTASIILVTLFLLSMLTVFHVQLAQATTDTFGNDDHSGLHMDCASPNTINTLNATSNTTGYAYGLKIWGGSASGDTVFTKAFLYNSTYNLLANSTQYNVTVGAETWHYINFTSSGRVIENTSYYFGVQLGDDWPNNDMYIGTKVLVSGGTSFTAQDTFSNGLSETLGELTNIGDHRNFAIVLLVEADEVEQSNCTLTVASSSGGVVDPVVGVYNVTENDVANLTAAANTGYVFNYWTVDGVYKSNLPTYNLTMDVNHQIKAHFMPVYQPNSTTQFFSEERAILVRLNEVSNVSLLAESLAAGHINMVYAEIDPCGWTGYSVNVLETMKPYLDAQGIGVKILLQIGAPIQSDYTGSDEAGYGYGFTSGYNATWQQEYLNGSYTGYISFNKVAVQLRINQTILVINTVYPNILGYCFDDTLSYAYQIGQGTFDVDFCTESRSACQAWLTANGLTFTGDWNDYVQGGSEFNIWLRWKVQTTNDALESARAEALRLNSKLTFGAAMEAPWVLVGGAMPADYLHYYYGVDYAFWVSQGWIDTPNPMIYKSDLTEISNIIGNFTIQVLGVESQKVRCVPFITQGGAGIGVSAKTTSALVNEVAQYKTLNCSGWILWRYAGDGSSSGFTDVADYLTSIWTATGYEKFKQTQPYIDDGVVCWTTSHNTTGKIEYSSSNLFTYNSTLGSTGSANLYYLTPSYQAGTLTAETTGTSFNITVPISTPYYFRIINSDGNSTAISPVYYNDGSWIVPTPTPTPTPTATPLATPAPGSTLGSPFFFVIVAVVSVGAGVWLYRVVTKGKSKGVSS